MYVIRESMWYHERYYGPYATELEAEKVKPKDVEAGGEFAHQQRYTVHEVHKEFGR